VGSILWRDNLGRCIWVKKLGGQRGGFWGSNSGGEVIGKGRFREAGVERGRWKEGYGIDLRIEGVERQRGGTGGASEPP
jgi:hypothetical protein